jgi:hypothetical protein
MDDLGVLDQLLAVLPIVAAGVGGGIALVVFASRADRWQ